MTEFQAFILGLVQGVTEFLPISSSAHLILVPFFADWDDQGLLFDISVHVGTLTAVMLYFRREVYMLLEGVVDVATHNFKTPQAVLLFMLALSTLPLVLVAPFIKDLVELGGRNIVVIAITSIVFGLLLWASDNKAEKCTNFKSLDALTWKHALIYGIFQCIALIPGTSRSGITMTAGRMLGYDRITSARFSMLMAMPVILMIAAFSLVSNFNTGLNFTDNAGVIAIGVGVSFVSALSAIHLLIKFVEKVGFLPFVIYRLVLGGVLLVIAF